MTNPRHKTIAFQVGETVTLRAIILDNDPESSSFKDRIDVSGPVNVQITNPDGTIDTTFAAGVMSNIATGVYEFNFQSSGKDAGDWRNRYRATHLGNFSIIDDVFRLEL